MVAKRQRKREMSRGQAPCRRDQRHRLWTAADAMKADWIEGAIAADGADVAVAASAVVAAAVAYRAAIGDVVAVGGRVAALPSCRYLA